MKRALTWTLMVLGFVFLGLVSTVLMRAEPIDEAPPDPAMLIHLGDGTARPLGEVVDLVLKGEPLPESQPLIRYEMPEAELAALSPEERAERERLVADVIRRVEAQIHGDKGSLFHLAEVARHQGRFDEAAALYLSIPEDDPRWARSRRKLAWDVMTKGQGQPRQAVGYVHAALAADPLNGNSWQDLARVYGATLGIDLD